MPDMKHVGKKFMRMTLDEAYQEYKLTNPVRVVARSTFCKYRPHDVKTVDNIPFRQCCCEQCENVRKLIIALISSGFKGIQKNIR